MINFGKYAILAPKEHRFENEPEWFWIIEPTDTADEIKLSQFMMSTRKVNNQDLPPTWLDVAMREIALSFGGTNIPVSETDPKPVLVKGAGVMEVEALLKQMPVEMVAELWKAVGEANPLWGPRLAPKPVEAETKSSES